MLDVTGFDPSSLTNANYLLGRRSAPKTMIVNEDWTLPKSGLSGFSTFCNCKAIMGDNATTYDSSKTGYTMMKVDTATTARYLTAG